ncbi:hypothetical protein RIF29_37944 [Crotalaria pallida]|uniref:Uncharacterized protein n=1 Tax=Crotalaria pallida TaxID=3830 RepID=A0AAN9DZ88_CROPI
MEKKSDRLWVVTEPEPELEPEASSDSASSDGFEAFDSSDPPVVAVSPLAVAPQPSLDSDSDSSFDLSDSDDNESTSSWEEDEQERVQQAVEEEVQVPQQPQGEQHIEDILGADIEEQLDEIDDPHDQSLLRSCILNLLDRYRDSLRRILELALPMHQSGVLDPHVIQQIVDISSRPMGHVVPAVVRGGHVPQRGGRADRGGRAYRGGRGGGRRGGRAKRGDGRRVRVMRG